jgi:hypothetical protein
MPFGRTDSKRSQQKRMTILGKDMKIKTLVGIMNVVANETRLGLKVVLCALRSILLTALLISCAHLVNGEVLEYSINYESKIDSTFDGGKFTDGSWNKVAVVNLKEGESLEMIAGSFIRQLKAAPDNWVRDTGFSGNWVRFIFKHEYLDEEVTIQHWGLKQNNGKNVFFGGNSANNIDAYNEHNDIVKSSLMQGPCEIVIMHCPLQLGVKPNGKDSSYNKTYTPKQRATIRLNKTTINSANAQSIVNKNILVLPKGSGVNELILESSEDLITWEKDVPGDKNTDAANRFYRLRAVKK